METRNYVLRALTETDREALEPFAQTQLLASGEVLYEPDYPVDWVYFPNTAVLSVVTVMADGRTVESDTVGYESVVGVLNALGACVAVNRTFTQIPGSAIRVSSSRLRHAADRSSTLLRLLIRHAQANLAQAHQSVACNALHGLNQRLCRWLLMSQDRTAETEVHPDAAVSGDHARRSADDGDRSAGRTRRRRPDTPGAGAHRHPRSPNACRSGLASATTRCGPISSS